MIRRAFVALMGLLPFAKHITVAEPTPLPFDPNCQVCGPFVKVRVGDKWLCCDRCLRILGQKYPNQLVRAEKIVEYRHTVKKAKGL
jgi:hypothetical protein